MTVTSPAVGTSVSKSAGLSVTWTFIPNSMDSIVIWVIDSTNSSGSVNYYTADNGSFTVPSSAWSSFTVGDLVEVSVKRYDEKYGVDPLGRRYIMGSYTESDIDHLLGP